MAFRSFFTLSLAASTLALAAPQNIDNGQTENCPDGWSYNGGNSVGGTELPGYCCPGSSDIDGTMQFCVVGTSTVPVTAAGYTSIVSSLYAKESGSGNNGGAIFSSGASFGPGFSTSVFISAGPSGTTTEVAGASGSGATTSAGPSGTTTGVATAASSGSSSSSSGGAAMITAAPMLGAAALALLVL